MLFGVVHGGVCLISVVRARGTMRTLRAYARGELGTDRFLDRIDPCARAAVRFRAAVICMALAGLACITVMAFPGRTAVAPLAAAFLAVILRRTFDLVSQAWGGWFLDPLIPDSVILDMTASADPWTRFRAGWTMNGRVAMLRRAAASRPDLPPEIRQILLAQYSPGAIFVPLELAPKSVGSELRLMLSGWRIGGAAMVSAALLALVTVTLLPRDLLLMPALNELKLPDLQTRPDQMAKERDTPSSGPDRAGNGTNPEPNGDRGGPSDAQSSDGAEDGTSPAPPAGGGEPAGEGGRGSPGGSSGGAEQEGQADQAGVEPGKDAPQPSGDRVSDASSNADGDQPAGRSEAPEPSATTDEAASAEDGSGKGGQGPEGQASPDGDQQGQAGEDGGAESSQQGQGAGEETSNTSEDSGQGDPGVGEDGPGQELGGSQDPDGRGDGTAEEGDEQMIRAPANPDEAGGNSSGFSGPTDLSSEGALAGITEYTGEPPEAGEIIQTEVTAAEADPVRVGPLFDGDIDETPTQELSLREAALPPQTDVALELTAGGPAALFAEEGEVPDAVEARLLPDARTMPVSQGTPSAARQILPAWIDEIMR